MIFGWIGKNNGESSGTGTPGKSAYQIALENGFVGTEADWLESLKGKDGADGEAPKITVVENTDDVYVLGIETATNFFETPNLKPAVRVPVTVTAKTSTGYLAGQPLSIQATGSGVQKTVLDKNGQFHDSLRTATDYKFTVLRKSAQDMLFPASEIVTTGTLNIPLDVNIHAIFGGVHANLPLWDEIKFVIDENLGKEVVKTVSTFGNLSGNYKWIGGVVAPNGKVYGIPYDSTTVLEIDPETKTISTFGNLSESYKWVGGVLAPNGKVYGIPCGSTTVLEIDLGSELSPILEPAILSSWINNF